MELRNEIFIKIKFIIYSIKQRIINKFEFTVIQHLKNQISNVES